MKAHPHAVGISIPTADCVWISAANAPKGSARITFLAHPTAIRFIPFTNLSIFA